MGQKKLAGLTVKETKMIFEKLLSEKESVVKNLEGFQQVVDNEGKSDEVDMANADYTNAHILRMRNREIFYLKKLNQAIEKFEDNSYGSCEECGCDIKFARLWARPTAQMCITCKEESERSEQSHIAGKKSKSMGETISLTPQL